MKSLATLALLALSGWGAHAAGPEAVTFDGPAGGRMRAELYRPAGSGPFPAVVALHGCGGLYDKDGRLNPRHSDWGERLAGAGFIVLLPDSFGSRGLGPQCRERCRTVRPGRERVADAFAAKAYLQARPDVKAASVSLLGWSNGGTTVLQAVSTTAARETGADFARAVAFYPGCRVPLERGWRDRMPPLILVGGDDDWTGADPCEKLVSAAKARSEPVEIIEYPGAVHDFDHPHLRVRERNGLAYTVGRNGMAHSGTEPGARADALRRVPEFLAH